ncbi:hypothetical protein U9M48_014808 [Paspalum notatum var. saurae]|uniref:Uncharacterized protein n=1 Tax=Paspalum notatum var. saurae TaxID=547442 RepID=A0AAQ3T2F9_PASNO
MPPCPRSPTRPRRRRLAPQPCHTALARPRCASATRAPGHAAAIAAVELGLRVTVERLAALRVGRKEDAEVRRDN